MFTGNHRERDHWSGTAPHAEGGAPLHAARTRAGGMYLPCAPSDPGAQEMSLQYFADNSLADKVLPPKITMRDFQKVRQGGGRGYRCSRC